MTRFNFDHVSAAISAIDPIFLNTPQYESLALSQELGCSVTLKVETSNPIRSFKGRGTELALSRLSEMGRQAVVCASAGNLGQAIAYSAVKRGQSAIVVAARSANALKLERIRAIGAELRLVDGDIENARDAAREVSQREGAYLIEDSENLDTCIGAGTIGVELSKLSPPFDVVLVALGGGALASGVGCAIKQLSPKTKVITVQPAGAPAMTLSWRTGTVVTTPSMDTIADGVAGRFPIAEVLDDLLEVIDAALLIEEASIVQSMKLLFELCGLVAEPSAALGVAAILENSAQFSGKRVATIICGSNVHPGDFQRWTSS